VPPGHNIASMSRALPIVAACILAIALAACGSPRSNTGFVPGVADGGNSSSGRSASSVRLTITLPAISKQNAPIDWASNPNLLSAATRSVAGSIGTRSFGPIGLSPDGCEAASDGLSCAFSVTANAGKHQQVHIRTYATVNATGPVLASANVLLDVTAGKHRFTAPPMVGIARSLVAQPLDGTVRRGTWEPVPIAVYGIDAAKAPIPSHDLVDRHGNPVTGIDGVKLAGFVNETIAGSNGADLACCGGIVATFAYDGLRTGHETFSVVAKGFQSQPSALKAVNGPGAIATVVTGSSYSNSPSYVSFIVQYAAGASGNVPPVRSFVPPNGSNRPFGEDERGTFWVDGTHFANDGSILGTVALPAHTSALARDVAGNLYAATACAIFEYPAGHYGKPAAIRQVRYPQCGSPTDLAVDSNGTIFVSLEDRGNVLSEILEYGTSDTAPARIMHVPAGHNVTGLDTDSHGNLYVLDVIDTHAKLLQFAPSARRGRPLLNGIAIQTFAVDDDGGIYARVYSDPGGSLEYFAPGASVPSQIISGENTQLYDVGPITVPRI
jgi:hypothetical protein